MNAAQRPAGGRRGRPETPLPAPDSPLARLGAHLRKLRRINGLSQTELAQQAECSSTTISQTELGKFRPSPELVATFDTILHGDGILTGFLADVVAEDRSNRPPRSPAQARRRPHQQRWEDEPRRRGLHRGARRESEGPDRSRTTGVDQATSGIPPAARSHRATRRLPGAFQTRRREAASPPSW